MNTPTKACRNCGSTEVYEGDSARTIALELTPFALPPRFHLRICGACGLLEWFLAGEDLQRMKQKFGPRKA